MRILKRGSRGQAVKDVQTKLKIKADGHFGPKTEAAVRAYQRYADIKVDGIAGPVTMAALGLTAKPAKGAKKMNAAGLELVKKFEGLFLKAYKCPAGVWTIGYGHTGGVKAGMKISKTQAEALLVEDMVKYAAGAERQVRVKLTSNQFSALTSFTFNCGIGALGKSTLLKKLNAGDYKGAADELLKWTRGGGRVLPGLVRRRKAERELFLKR